MKRNFGIPAAALGLTLLILYPKTALDGVRSGMELCMQTVIPALFPFLVITGYLVGNLPRQDWLRPLGRLLRIPVGAEGIFLTGLLGGYPTGAAAVTQAWENGILTREQAHRLLGFCSNAGPAFLFGMLSGIFPDSLWLWALWAIHLMSAVLTGISLPGTPGMVEKPGQAGAVPLSQAVNRAVGTMAKICGWVVLFRVVIAFSQGLCFSLPGHLQATLWGLLELTNGCLSLGNLAEPGLRFFLCAGFLGFGGLCVGMQTRSVTGKLGTGQYFPGKLLQTGFSLVLALPALNPGLWPITVLGICAPFVKISSSIFRPKPV